MRASPQAAGPGEVRLHSPTGRAVVAAAVLYALPVFVTLMFIVGSQDAFDLLGTSLGVRLRVSCSRTVRRTPWASTTRWRHQVPSPFPTLTAEHAV